MHRPFLFANAKPFKWCLWAALLVLLLSSAVARAETYNISTGSYPPCTGGSWYIYAGVYVCPGRVTLANNDIVTANNDINVYAENGFALATGTTIGTSTNTINLISNYGTVVSTGATTVYGNVNAGSGVVTLVNATVNGTLRSSANINLTGGSVSGLVTTTNNTLTTSATNLLGGATAHSGMSVTGGTLAGNFTMTAVNTQTFSGVTMTNGTVSGASSVSIQGGSVLGSSGTAVTVSSNSGAITVNNSLVYGNLTAPNYSTVNVTNGGQVYGTCTPGSTPANACNATPPPSACPDGFSSGITGIYYDNTTLAEPSAALRTDSTLNFNWAAGAPGVTGVDADTFSVRWSGQVRAATSGLYRFRTVSDDGVRLYVNGNLVINRWNDHASATDTTGDIQLFAGQTYSLVLEYYENGGSSVIQLSWLTPGAGSYVAIPAGPTPTLGSGLYECITVVKAPISSCSTTLTAGVTGKYFNNMLASGTIANTRLDGPINFDWSTGSTGVAGVNSDQFSVLWEGYIRVAQSGNYRFQTNSDDGVRLTINGDLVIDQWNDHSVTAHTSGFIGLSAGSAYPFKMEMYENGGFAVAQMRWQTPAGGAFVAVPSGTTPPTGAGLYDCVTTPAAYTVAANTTGLTCAAEAVTVTALNASGNAYSPPVGTVVTLSTNVAGSAWVGGNTYTFTGTESSFTKYLQQTSPAAVIVTATSATATGSSSAITFADVGLKVADAFSPSLTPVKNQIAGISGTAILKAVRKDNNTGACVAQVGAGTRAVSFGFTCNNPTTCVAGQVFSVNNTAVTANNNGAALASAPVNVTFNASGEAPLTINYSDAGQVSLHAQFSLTASGNNPAITLTGSSDPFVVRPNAIVVSKVQRTNGTNNPGGTSVAGTAAQFVAAGDQFRVELEARNGAVPSAITPNFGRETGTSEATKLAIAANSLIYPTVGTLTPLTVNGTASATTPQGTFVFSNVRWNQVGSITIAPQFTGSGTYLNSAAIPNLTPSGTVGRFYPDHFALTATPITPTCGAFTYMSQPFSVSYTLEARMANNIGGLSNYSFTANNGSTYGTSATSPVISYVAENADSGTNLGARLNDGGLAKVFSSGQMAVNAPNTVFSRATSAPLIDGPFDSLTLGLQLTDSFDSRPLKDMNMNAGTTGTCSGAACNARSLGSSLSLRYGRLRLDDASGPEVIALPVNLITEYWTGTRFIKNTGDSCTKLPRSTVNFPAGNILTDANRTVALTGGNTTGTFASMDATHINFAAGDARHSFTAPTGNGTGEFNVSVNLSSSPWLRFDWNQSNSIPTDANCALPISDSSRDTDCDIRARFRFGSFRGHDRVIYWRERFN